MADDTITHWSPSEPADRSLLRTLVLVVGTVSSLLVLETIAWDVVGIGFVAAVIALGPIADSSIGTRVGAWFQRIGTAGRAVVLVAYAVVVSTAIPLLNVPIPVAISFTVGGLGGIVAMEALEAVRARR